MTTYDFEQQRKQIMLERAMQSLGNVRTSVTVTVENITVSLMTDITATIVDEINKAVHTVLSQYGSETEHKMLASAIYITLANTCANSDIAEITVDSGNHKFTYHFNQSTQTKGS